MMPLFLKIRFSLLTKLDEICKLNFLYFGWFLKHSFSINQFNRKYDTKLLKYYVLLLSQLNTMTKLELFELLIQCTCFIHLNSWQLYNRLITSKI